MESAGKENYMNFIITKHNDDRISTSIITDDENEESVAEYLQPAIDMINTVFNIKENSSKVNHILNYTAGYVFALYVDKIINRSLYYSTVNTAKTVVSQYTSARIVQTHVTDEIFTSPIKLEPTAIKLILDIANNIRTCDNTQDISNHVSVINGMAHCFVNLGLFKKEDFKDIFDMVSLQAAKRTSELTGCECEIEYRLIFE